MNKEKNTYTIKAGSIVLLAKHNGEQVFIPVIFRSGKGKDRLETDSCPFCFKTHIHGASEGSRIPHCLPEYRKDILWPDGTVSKKEYGYYILNRPYSLVLNELHKQGSTGVLKKEFHNLR